MAGEDWSEQCDLWRVCVRLPGGKSAFRIHCALNASFACSKSHIGQCPACVEVCRHANFSPALCVGCTGRVRVGGVLCRVAAQQEMCGQTIGGSQSKDDLSDLDWVAGLMAPVRGQCLDH